MASKKTPAEPKRSALEIASDAATPAATLASMLDSRQTKDVYHALLSNPSIPPHAILKWFFGAAGSRPIRPVDWQAVNLVFENPMMMFWLESNDSDLENFVRLAAILTGRNAYFVWSDKYILQNDQKYKIPLAFAYHTMRAQEETDHGKDKARDAFDSLQGTFYEKKLRQEDFEHKAAWVLMHGFDGLPLLRQLALVVRVWKDINRYAHRVASFVDLIDS